MLSFDHSARFGLVMVGRVLSKIPDFVTTNTAGVRYVSTKVSRGFTLTFFKTPFPPVVPGLVAAVPPSCYITTIPCTSRHEGQPIHVCCELLPWFAENVKPRHFTLVTALEIASW